MRRFDGANWVPVGSLGFSAQAAHYLAMAIDAQDVPYVVFRDPSQGLKLTLMRYAPSPYTYCTAVVSSAGCTPQIAATGTPSVTGLAPFNIGATQVISQRTGMLLYSLKPAHSSFMGGTLCLLPPLERAGLQNSGGNPDGNDCTGVLEFDFNPLLQDGLHPAFIPGQMVFAQWWYRDQQNPNGPGLSNAVRFTIGL